jgi:L-2-hydroxyglutarate oxidase LhgO
MQDTFFSARGLSGRARRGPLARAPNALPVKYDIAIIGGGIVGLATARELALRHPSLRIALLEKEPALAQHQSGHNSGVIHSGIYYKPGSLKAQLCVAGRIAAWEYCDRNHIEYRNVGKLIVATQESEIPALEELWRRGLENGIDGMQMLDKRGIREREPYCRGVQAIFLPMTGIVDWQRVALAYADDLREAGGTLLLGHEVTGLGRRNGVTAIATTRGSVETRYAIACAGLYSDRVAKLTGGTSDPKIVPFRGDYMVLRPEMRYLVRGNIYPVPDASFPFLGVHFTPRMDGSLWLGPNAVLAFAREGYKFSDVNLAELSDAVTYPGFLRLAAKYWKIGAGEMFRDLVRSAYVKALQRYIPDLMPEDCLPGPSGVRAQAMSQDGSLVDDFVFERAEGIVHVRNAPSPGATSSLAIGRHIADDAARQFDLRGVSV